MWPSKQANLPISSSFISWDEIFKFPIIFTHSKFTISSFSILRSIFTYLIKSVETMLDAEKSLTVIVPTSVIVRNSFTTLPSISLSSIELKCREISFNVNSFL